MCELGYLLQTDPCWHAASDFNKRDLAPICPGVEAATSRNLMAYDGTAACHAFDYQLYQAVVEEEAVARLYNLGQRLETHRNALRVADDILVGQCEAHTRTQVDRLRLYLPDASWVRAGPP